MAITNHERVGKALDLLRGGLGPIRRARVATPGIRATQLDAAQSFVAE